MKKTSIFFSIVSFFLVAVICPLIIASCPNGGDDPPPKGKSIAREDDGWTDEDVARITVLEYFQQLRALTESKTVMSGHNDEPNLRPTKDTDNFALWTGKYPAMWSGDFLYQDPDVSEEGRWTMIREARRQWEMGNIVHLMFHVTSVKYDSNTDVGLGSIWESSSSTSVPCVGGSTARLSVQEWISLLTDGQALNTRWKERLKVYYPYFQYLKDYGVTVMFRPFHEMNQTFFWWGSSSDNAQNRTSALFRMTRDIFDAQGFDNIVWVWNTQDISTGNETAAVNTWSAYNPNSGASSTNYPGDPDKDYWDVFCVDLYSVGGYPIYLHTAATTVAGSTKDDPPKPKPIGIGEVYTLPTPQQLTDQPNWVFAMPWPKDMVTTPQQLNTLYAAPNAVVHGMLPPFVRGNTLNKVRNPGFIALSDDDLKLPRAWTTEYSGGASGTVPIKVEHGRLVGSGSTPYSFTMSQTIADLTPGKYEFSAFFKKARTTIIGGGQTIVMNVYSSDGETRLATRNISSVVANLQAWNANNTYSNDHWVDLQVNVPDTTAKIEIVVTGVRNFLAVSGASFRKI